LREARKVLGWERAKAETSDVLRDFSLKEGEKIHIQVGGKGRREGSGDGERKAERQDEGQALFSIAPPPPAASASSGFSQQASGDVTNGKSAAELGFDDGEFGEFQ
jgi:hypothetical protein